MFSWKLVACLALNPRQYVSTVNFAPLGIQEGRCSFDFPIELWLAWHPQGLPQRALETAALARMLMNI